LKDKTMYDNIQLFVELVNSGSIAKTAATRNISPKTINNRINDLEKNLNLILLEKNAQGVKPTKQGQQLYEMVFQPLKNLSLINDEINKNQSHIPGELRISIPQGLASIRLDPYLHEFNALHPEIQLKLYYLNTDYNLSHDFDIVITSRFPKNDNVKVRKIYSTSLVLACSKSYNHYKLPPTKLDEIKNHLIVGPRRRSYIPYVINIKNPTEKIEFELQPDIIVSTLSRPPYLAYYNNYIALCMYEQAVCFNLQHVLPECQFGKIDYFLIRSISNKKSANLFIEFIEDVFKRTLISLF